MCAPAGSVRCFTTISSLLQCVTVVPFRHLRRRRYRVVMMGDAGVGKTALVSQFMTSEYMHTYDASLGKLQGKPPEVDRRFVISLLSPTNCSVPPILTVVQSCQAMCGARQRTRVPQTVTRDHRPDTAGMTMTMRVWFMCVVQASTSRYAYQCYEMWA